ncbi:MAG: carbohydrate ABC transporter permease [Thermomicrobiales bacterium]
MQRIREQGLGVTLVTGFLVVCYLFPVYWMVATSLKPQRDVFAVPPKLVPWPPTFASYETAVLDNELVARSLLNSAVIGIGATLLTMALAVPAAYGLARLRLRFTVAFGLFLLISQMLPSINLALPLFVLFSKAGLVNSYAGLIIANASVTVPFAIIVLRPFFLTVPGEVIEASRVDGSTRFGAFWRIALPLALPGLITVATLSFLMAWGDFVFGLTLATSEKMVPVTVSLSQIITQFGTRWNDLMAVSTVVALPIIIFFVFLQRYIVGGLTAGSLKE